MYTSTLTGRVWLQLCCMHTSVGVPSYPIERKCQPVDREVEQECSFRLSRSGSSGSQHPAQRRGVN
ncbi:hypothetical protein DPX39_010047800 [Trypanosoma brucei equiperdum]|uniref:Uncharacterized protein n=1 Tax=Trypanosoma brucei equiperdum TaxID=630700 RepID=A0A3L6LC13_9TRYP|nr:hypothetical protein DPX39_010047800 [Trypanosoma brucei equiperdum]